VSIGYEWGNLAKRLWTGWFVVTDETGKYLCDRWGNRYGAQPTKERDDPMPTPSVFIRARRLNTKPISDVLKATPVPDNWAPATLQDYWLADPATGALRKENDLQKSGELVSPPNYATGAKVYHLVHLPVRYKEGGYASDKEGKADLLAELVAQRLACAHIYRHTWRDGDCDRRAQLCGAILLEAPRPPLEDVPISATFEDAVFDKSAVFSAPVASIARFQSLVDRTRLPSPPGFEQRTSFRNAMFRTEAKFVGVHFLGSVDFTGAHFKEHVSFASAKFDRGEVKFVDCKVPLGGDFGASFGEMPDFAGAELHPSTTFRHAAFWGLGKSAWAIQGAFISALGFSLLFLLWALNTDGFWSGVLWFLCVMTAMLLITVAIAETDGVTASREADAARVLVKIAENNRNHLDQARFFRHMLKAERLAGARTVRQAPAKAVERTIGIFYELVSDYGLSIARPLIALGVMTLTFAVLWWSWEGGGLSRDTRGAFWSAHGIGIEQQRVDPAYVDAFAFSMSRILPIGPWGEIVSDDGVCSFRERLLAMSDQVAIGGDVPCAPTGIDSAAAPKLGSHRLAVQSAATAQSIIAAILIFLFARGVRRRYHIS
jgi:hypothetical protein